MKFATIDINNDFKYFNLNNNIIKTLSIRTTHISTIKKGICSGSNNVYEKSTNKYL